MTTRDIAHLTDEQLSDMLSRALALSILLTTESLVGHPDTTRLITEYKRRWARRPPWELGTGKQTTSTMATG